MPWLAGIRTAQAFRGINIVAALKAQLTREQQRLLDERAPVAISVPSGSRVKLDYSSGDLPVLAVKLQEMFGLADTPTLAAGRAKILASFIVSCRPAGSDYSGLKRILGERLPFRKKRPQRTLSETSMA